MRVALIIGGLPRLYHKSLEFWEKFIDNYNPDVFVHTWDNKQYYDIQLIEHKFRPKLLVAEPPRTIDVESYQDRTVAGVNAYNILSSWASKMTAFEMAKSYYNCKRFLSYFR